MAESQRNRLFGWLHRHIVCTFLLMSLSFVTFGWLTFDLVRIFSANVDYVLSNGWQGWVDGGFEELFQLALTALFAMFFYIVFKMCETVLVQRFLNKQGQRDK